MSARATFLMAVAAVAALSTVSPAYGQSNGCRAIEGAWKVFVDQPGETNDFETMVTYTGGTTVEQNGAPGAGPAVGVYDCEGGRHFRATWHKRIYNRETGALIVIVKIRASGEVTSDEEYTSDDKIDIYTPDGQLIFSTTAKQRGRRIVVEK